MTKVSGMILKIILRTVLVLSSAMVFVSHVQRNCIRNYMTKKLIKMYGSPQVRLLIFALTYLYKIRVVLFQLEHDWIFYRHVCDGKPMILRSAII